MTDSEAMQRYIKAFDTSLPEFSNYDFWDKLYKGTDWIKKNYSNSPFSDVAEEYERALFKIACIRHEIVQEGGKNIERCRKKV